MFINPKLIFTSNDERYLTNKDVNRVDENEGGEVSTGDRRDNKQNSTTITWKRKFKSNPREDCALKGEVCHEFPENV